MKKRLFATVMLLAASPVMAGDNNCQGTIVIGKDGTSAIVNSESAYTLGRKLEIMDVVNLTTCLFETNSKVGRQILKTCPNGSLCYVEMSVGSNRAARQANSQANANVSITKIKEVINVERVRGENNR